MAEEKDNRVNGAGENPEEEIIEGEVVEVENSQDETSDDVAAKVLAADLLAAELQQAQDKAKEYFEGWQRERADFANYKRRVERDQQMMAQSMKGDIIKKYLTVLDDLERALKARPTEGPVASWANGIELIQRKLQSILESEGVKRIQAEGELFDPTRHEAITYEDSPDHESGQIIEVVQQGYTLGDRVLRPALVRVARG